jgi:hypothetical protein
VASFATQPWCYGKSVNEKLPRPADLPRRMFQRFACSFGLHRVGVPMSIHESSPHVKLIFQIFCTFLRGKFQNIEKSMFSFLHFLSLFTTKTKNLRKIAENALFSGQILQRRKSSKPSSSPSATIQASGELLQEATFVQIQLR